MPTVINTNLASLYAQNNLSNAQNNLALSVQRLSSGLRINSAKDDAAGLAITQNMQGQINGIDQSRKNLNDAVNLTQVAESSLGTIHQMLLRMKQLSVQGYDGSLSASQRTQIVDEIAELNTEINNTATRTKFNGNSLISNEVGILSGDPGTAVSGLALTGATVTGVVATGAKADTYTFVGTATNTTIALQRSSDSVSQTLTISGITAGQTYDLNFDALGIKLSYTVGSGGNATANTIGDVLKVTGGAKTIKVTGTAPAALTFQGGADTGVSNIITYNAINVKTDGSAGTENKMNLMGAQVVAMALYTSTTAQATWASAFSTLDTQINNAIDYVSEQRSVMGALQNRVSYIMSNLEAQSTNMKSSKSQILDTDFAAETASLTKGQIMQQAATAMLAQANQMPNVVLSLLK
jgi:flagellin